MHLPSERRRAPTSAWLQALLVAAALGTAAPVGAQPPAPDQRADVLYREGNDAFKKGELDKARAAYLEAYALKPSFDVAGNLGAAEFQMGRFRDAAEHLAASLRVAPVNGSAEAKAKTEKLLQDAKAKIASLVLTTSEPGADIEVDGKSIGRSPLAGETYVEPGRRVITAKLGAKTATVELDATAGTSRDVALDLREPAAPAVPPPSSEPATPPPDEPREGPPLWPGFVIGGVGVVGVGVGIGLLAAGGSALSDAETNAASLRASGTTCSAAGAGSAACDQQLSDIEGADGLRTGGAIAVTVGGAALAGGVVYLVWAATQGGPSDSASSIRPWSGPGLVGTGFQGAF